MRLSEFIQNNTAAILNEWEEFARSIWPAPLQDPSTDPAMLRDHAEDILRAACHDMTSSQSGAAQQAKSQGVFSSSLTSARLDHASEKHAMDRATSGFELWALVAEYRALRASVIRLWRESDPQPDVNDLDDLTRFNESIDQSLTEAIRAFTEQVDEEREKLLAATRQALLEAESANKAKDTFLATLSHELRNPLAAVVTWTEVMRMRKDPDPELAEGLEAVERNAKALVLLIEEMLDVARIVAGKLRIDRVECDLVKAVAAGVDVLRSAAQSRHIALEVDLDPQANPAIADPTRIQQIVWNLVSNAIKFTPEGGRVWISLERVPSGRRLTVKDNGRGISPELLPHVFERFRQGEQRELWHSGGLGLGLSIVKHIVELHGGTVEALSDGEGEGTTMVVTLPEA